MRDTWFWHMHILYLNTYHQHNAVGNFSVRVLCVGFSGFGCCNFVTLFMIMIVSIINGYTQFFWDYQVLLFPLGIAALILKLPFPSCNTFIHNPHTFGKEYIILDVLWCDLFSSREKVDGLAVICQKGWLFIRPHYLADYNMHAKGLLLSVLVWLSCTSKWVSEWQNETRTRYNTSKI